MRNLQRITALLLMLVTVIGLLPLLPIEAQAASNKTVLIAASDFQSYEDAHNTCRNQMNKIFWAIKKDYSHADGFLFAGDYYHQYDNYQSELGIQTMTETVLNAGFGIEEDNIIKVQGNHDQVGTRYLSPSGENDPESEDYGVFVINEDDFMWFAGSGSQNGSENVNQHASTVEKTAENLRDYLQDKIDENFTAPIFVVSHLPLHYSMRTYVYGDGRYARYIYDELEYGANAGLNIVFLFGHNHSHGWDHHLGASSIYLTRGDTINIGVPSNPAACVQETLNFTYLNAGYIGYFSTDYNEPVDTTLTMTVYEFDDDELIIKRYDQNGLHSLKSAGGVNEVTYRGRTEAQHGIFSINPKVYSSTQTLELLVDGQEPVSATCKQTGTKGYVVTASGKVYTDATLTKPTTIDAQKLPLGKHRYDYESLGKLQHRVTCENCTLNYVEDHSYYSFSCENCAEGRTLTKVPAKEPTCSEAGNVLYYWHPETKSYYTDKRGYNETTLEEVTLAPLPHAYKAGYEATADGHRRLCSCGAKEALSAHSFVNGVCSVCSYEKSLKLTFVAHKASTCKVQGNNAYYFDPATGLCYKDAKGTQVTTAAKELLPLAAHSYGSDHLCRVCRAKDPAAPAPTTSAVIPTSSQAPAVSIAPAASTATLSSVPVVTTVPASSVIPLTSTAAAESTAATTGTAATSTAANQSVAATQSAPASSSLLKESSSDLTLVFVVVGVVILGAAAVGTIIILKKKRA